MRMMAILLAALAFAVLAGEYEINVPNLGSAQSVLSIELTGRDLANLGGHTDWIRLYDKDGNVVPYALQQHYTVEYVKSRVKYPLKMKEVKHEEDGSLVIDCEIDTDKPLPEKMLLVFNTRVKDFEQLVSVVGFGENNTALDLLRDGFIFDSTSNIAVRNVEVEIKPGKYRHFKVFLKHASLERVSLLRHIRREWNNYGGGIMSDDRDVAKVPFKIDSLELVSEESVKKGNVPAWEKVECKFEDDPRHNLNGNNSYNLALPAYPVSGLHFRCKQENFSREIKIFHIDEDGKEALLNSGRITHINLGKLLDETLLVFSEVKSGKLRIECANKDNPPLEFTAMEARIPAYRLRILASAGMLPLKLTSTAGAKAPVYDTSVLLASGNSNPESDRIVHLEGFKGEIPQEIKRNPGMPRIWLFIALGVAVLVMGVAIVSTARKI
ncbi:MAG: hypothetical protein IJS08_06840 [Victivallales bacterium]|nr:hypothetical protein [Victivallales bacterium]